MGMLGGAILPMYVIRNLSKSIKIQIVYHSFPKHVKSYEFVQIQNQKAGPITGLSTLLSGTDT